MSTFEKILIGLFVVALIVISILAFSKPKDKGIVVDPGNGQPPVICNPTDPGYTMDGTLNPLCGTPKCDPNRKGWNLQGFPDADCGFGRIKQK